VEERPAAHPASSALPRPGDRPVPLASVDASAATVGPTGLAELDRVLGGGLVPGSVTLLGGEPGIGKSTLLLQALGRMAASGSRVLLVAAEESKEQVRLRAGRLDALHPDVLVVAETMLPHVFAHVDEARPTVLAVDSIQTVLDPEAPGAAGSVSQVRECAQRLVRLAKEERITTLLVGHVTEDGALAGPRALEHVVDTVLAFEGDRHHAVRLLRALKHRFGSTAELGLFEMEEQGLADVADPSALFLADRRRGVAGSAVTTILEGARPLVVEVQALVTGSRAESPRRSGQGLDTNRLALLLAVLQQRVGVPVHGCDVYTSVAGGIRVVDPGSDLAVVAAVASAVSDQPIAADVVALGEVGLGGELRQAPQTARRLAEAARLGFRRAVVSRSAPDVTGIGVVRVSTVQEALGELGVVPIAGAARSERPLALLS
jgi:DNA repair protein RadA/Sms